MKDSHINVIVLPNQIKTFVCFLAYGFSLTQIDRLRLSRNVLGNKIRSRLRSVRYLSLIFVVAIVCARPDEDNVFFIASCGHRVLEKHIIYVWVLFLFIQTWKNKKQCFDHRKYHSSIQYSQYMLYFVIILYILNVFRDVCHWNLQKNWLHSGQKCLDWFFLHFSCSKTFDVFANVYKKPNVSKWCLDCHVSFSTLF